ncbi:leucine-rich repeat-containing protein 71-like isoform X2 [Pomacea canaliculata]|uniref:leucine-rich repeat-containing protein 71-like isoform X2 n=1 Tax=Pomacea canaliculata TaxID=400727 RepID=UPI000D73BAE1|nr:leucine-rich repeat-containing protein 71-like isoform X2 [Pomacea canaliculata]
MCRRSTIVPSPSVVMRPKPGPPPPPPETKPEKGSKEKGKQTAPIPEPEPEPEVNEDGEPVEPPPKTYTTKDKFEYFKPCVQVEIDPLDKGEAVTEIYIRGWKIDQTMMEIFQSCWPPLEKLHTINLWEAGLTGEMLHLMASFLPLCVNLKNLILDGNPVKEENFHELIGEDSIIQNLSLRFCCISEVGARNIGASLGTTKFANTKLLSLNLSGNCIGDEGACHIAKGLRLNRNLLSLTLSSNKIGNKGAAKIAEALSRFALCHEEVVERRRLMSERGSPDRKTREEAHPPPSRRADSKDRPGSVRSSGTHADTKKTREKPSARKKEPKGKEAKDQEITKGGKKEKEDPKGTQKKALNAPKPKKKQEIASQGSSSQATFRLVSTLAASMVTDGAKTIGMKTKDKKKDKKPSATELEVDVLEVINPLMEEADFIDGELMIAGNRVLINLNLSRNEIGESGLQALLKAVQYQTTLTLDSRSSGTGLMRLCLTRNAVPADNDILKKITDHMIAKDPFYKSPVTPDSEQS